MYFQRFRRWPIFKQLLANVACFLANNAWYPYLCEQLSHLNRRPEFKTHRSVVDRERGRRRYPPSSVQRTKTRPTTRPYKHDPKTRPYKAFEPKYL